MQNRGFIPPANVVAYRTMYNDVETIKDYLRKFKPTIDDETIYQIVDNYLANYTTDSVINALTSNAMYLISPLRTSYVTTDFIDYIIKDVVTCSCTSAKTIDLISNNFMSIIDYNSEAFFNYITGNLTLDVTSSDVINIITENKETILNYISGDIYSVISGYISECSCEESGSIDVTNQVQQALADQYPELDVKYLLRDYHLIDKHSINLTSNVLTIPTDSLYNPASGFERFRLLAHISSDSTVIEPLTDFDQELVGTAYQFYDPVFKDVAAKLTTTNTGLSLFLTGFFNSHIDSQSVLWYGFTDLINTNFSKPPDYAVLVSIDCSPNYLKLMDYNDNGASTGYMTVPYSDRNAYNKKYATNVRKQFGAGIEVVEVVPHPLLINDSERYIVIRAITDSSKKGYWNYRNNGTTKDTYTYNRTYNRSVLKFSPLESPIMYASILADSQPANYYIYKLDQTFAGRSDIYSVDLSNFVPFDSALPNYMTDVRSATPLFNNINIDETNMNFGLLHLDKAFQSCNNLASIDLSYIESFVKTDNNTFNETFAYCSNVQTIYCNSLIGGLLSTHFGTLVDLTDNGKNAIVSGRTWKYDDTLGAIVFTPK